DLNRGVYTKQFSVPTVSSVIGLNPDGKSILVRDADRQEHLELISVADQRPLLSWRPYEKEPAEARAVVWAGFADPQHVLTINSAGTLILWGVPECRVNFTLPNAFKGVPVLGHGRRTLVGLGPEGLRFLEPSTFKWQGIAALPQSVEGKLI